MIRQLILFHQTKCFLTIPDLLKSYVLRRFASDGATNMVQLLNELRNHNRKLFVSATKIGETSINILKCCFSR